MQDEAHLGPNVSGVAEVDGPFLVEARKGFHVALLKAVLIRDKNGVVSNADSKNKNSKAIASGIADLIGVQGADERLAAQMSGRQFEEVCAQFLRTTFPRLHHLRPGDWIIENLAPTSRTKRSKKPDNKKAKSNSVKGKGLADYYQYSHLGYLAEIAAQDRKLAAALGNDYIISPDVVIARRPETDERLNGAGSLIGENVGEYTIIRERANTVPILHATISCKWTMRSDRAQNARTEGLNLIRHRRGPTPQIVAITGEPMPTRIASLAFGVGDIDCVYHFALQELVATITELKLTDHLDLLEDMIGGNRLKDISDLPLDLAV